jgi:hypothetical protein
VFTVHIFSATQAERLSVVYPQVIIVTPPIAEQWMGHPSSLNDLWNVRAYIFHLVHPVILSFDLLFDPRSRE